MNWWNWREKQKGASRVTDEDRGREKGSGIGSSSGEGGTSEDSPICERETQGAAEMERVGGRKQQKERNREEIWIFFSPAFSLCGSVELFLLWKNFLHSFLPLHSFWLHFDSLCLKQFHLPFLFLVILSVLISAFLSMASTLCIPPPVFINLYSPRMHLFKACFTKTVLKQRERWS